MKRAREIVYSLVEYVLAALFIRGGINVLFFDVEPATLPGYLTYLVGEAAIFIYGAMFLVTGLLLLYAKWFRKKRCHKFALLVMYLTCIYVFVLSVMINGLSTGIILTVVVGIASAALWVRWKFKTEYIDINAFKKEIRQLTKE